ncbi:hypothetical protein ACFY1J_24095 [Streptomyces sp. NPDC001406]|uniref:hypothetical protein n=1 Tax=Streptomyces sp. NPDC001406 TaxID=3364572 RepID=UPI003698378B
MLVQRLAAVACLAAGVGVLAGPGWALFALGVLLWGSGPRARSEAAQPPLDAAVTRAREIAKRLRGSAVQAAQKPRQTTAVASMAAGIAGVPAGVLLTVGAGAAVATAGGLLIGLGILTGWNA